MGAIGYLMTIDMFKRDKFIMSLRDPVESLCFSSIGSCRYAMCKKYLILLLFDLVKFCLSRCQCSLGR